MVSSGWAPLVDRLPIPLLTRLLGRRRSWLLLAHRSSLPRLSEEALTDPCQALLPGVWCARWRWRLVQPRTHHAGRPRIESAARSALAAAYQTGYRIAMIRLALRALWIAARRRWRVSSLPACGRRHLVMAGG
jgi:PAT family beta-lactamase induction signal transducer AmpG